MTKVSAKDVILFIEPISQYRFLKRMREKTDPKHKEVVVTREEVEAFFPLVYVIFESISIVETNKKLRIPFDELFYRTKIIKKRARKFKHYTVLLSFLLNNFRNATKYKMRYGESIVISAKNKKKLQENLRRMSDFFLKLMEHEKFYEFLLLFVLIDNKQFGLLEYKPLLRRFKETAKEILDYAEKITSSIE